MRMSIFAAASSSSFITEIRIAAPPAAVHALLDDPRALIRLNPLVIGVEAGAPGEFLVTDALRMAGIPLRLRYLVRWRRDGDRIETEAESAFQTRLRNTLQVEPDGKGSRVVETVRVTALRPFIGYVCRTAKTAHEDMLNRLKARVEAGD